MPDFLPKPEDLNDSAVLVEEDKNCEDSSDDPYLSQLLAKSTTSKEALEEHLDNKPVNWTVSYDNIDGNSKANDFVMNEDGQHSYHWCSSVLFQDVVNGIEISDTKIQPDILTVSPEVRMSVTVEENEHLLKNYTLL